MDETQAAALRAPFEPNQIGKLPKPTKSDNQKGRCDECGGWHGLPAVHLDYVGHASVTDRLLKVDPLWTWEPLALDDHGLPALDGDRNLWIRLTISGVTRLGVGDGNSMKERIGDAIRNAAMRFGVALDLWSKEDLHAPTPKLTANEEAQQFGFEDANDLKAHHDDIAAQVKALPESVDRGPFKKYQRDHGWPMSAQALSGLQDMITEAE